MLSSIRAALSPFAVSAILALTAIGCGNATSEPVDCAYLPSKCPVLTIFRLCPNGGGSCTVDAAPATCSQDSCTLAPAQKLTIPLDGVALTSSTPDLLLHFAGNQVSATDVHVLIDGTEVAADDSTTGPDLLVKWAEGAAAPKKIEISFTGNGGPVDVAVLFESIQCQMDELSSCHSGGA